jgi:hypothetical protein
LTKDCRAQITEAGYARGQVQISVRIPEDGEGVGFLAGQRSCLEVDDKGTRPGVARVSQDDALPAAIDDEIRRPRQA